MTRVDYIFGVIAAIEYGLLCFARKLGTPAAYVCTLLFLTILVMTYVRFRIKRLDAVGDQQGGRRQEANREATEGISVDSTE